MKNVADIYPLSPMQEMMLVHAVAHPGDQLLFNQVVYRLEGALDAGLYERCWQEVVDRHPMLRTLFLWEGLKAPVQVVRESVTLEWQNPDWSGQSLPEQEASLDALLAADRQRGFSLNQAPLMRFALCRRSDTQHTLVFSSHHLISDRWCIGILMSEQAALYDSKCEGTSVRLESRRPFRDYIRWLKEQDASAAGDFWRAELMGIHSMAGLDGGYQPAQEEGYGEQRLRLDDESSAALRRFATEMRLTHSTLVLGAWALLHGVYNDARDVLLGVTISGRPPALAGVEGMIGPFINNVPLRVEFPAETNLVEWLRGLQARQQAVQEQGHVSPLQLQEWSEMPHAGALFETLFLYQFPVKMPAFRLKMQEERTRLQVHSPITLAAEDGMGGLLLLIAYQRQRYTAEAAARLLDGMQLALGALMEQPDAAPGELVDRLRRVLPVQAPLSEAAQAANPDTAAVTAPPRSGLEGRLFNLWANVLGRNNFGIHDSFFELGATSLQAVQLLSRMRAAFEQEISVATLFAAPTIAQLAEAIARGEAVQPWSSLVPIKPGGHKEPLFLVHHGGGGITGYAHLASALDPERPLYGLQEPGLENGQALPDSVVEIARLYVEEVQSVQPHGPYYLGGFCFGGVVAFEMAQQLRRKGEEVGLLILLDAIRPGAQQANRIEDRLAAHKARMADRSTAGKVGYIVYRVLRRLGWEAERLYLVGRQAGERLAYEALDRIGRPVPSYLRQRRLLELNGQLNEAYSPQPYDGRALLVRGVYPELRYDLDFGWNAVVQPGVQTCLMNTDDHLQMMIDPRNLEVLVGHLQDALSPRGA